MPFKIFLCKVKILFIIQSYKITLFTDREYAFEDLEDEDEEMKHFFQDSWSEDFVPVATQLLQRMESYQSDLEPIEGPSGSW